MYFCEVMNHIARYLFKRLSAPLPGESAQRLMSPGGRIAYPGKWGVPRQSAVLSLFLPGHDNRWHLVLIKRPDYNGVHSGQIAFPGGRQEPDDPSLMHTALREAAEEIGLHMPVNVLGRLSDIYIPASNYLVAPFVAISEKRQNWIPYAKEVQQVLEMPIDELLDESKVASGHFITGFKKEVVSPYFALQEYRIWGATAMMMSELKCILIEGEKEWR